MSTDTETQPEAEPLPDMTPVLIADMREGVHRYHGIAAEAVQSAEKYRQAALEQDAAVIEYKAKAAALTAILRSLGYDPDDPTIQPTGDAQSG